MVHISTVPSIRWVDTLYQLSYDQYHHLAPHQAADKKIPRARSTTVSLFERIGGYVAGRRRDFKPYPTFKTNPATPIHEARVGI